MSLPYSILGRLYGLISKSNNLRRLYRLTGNAFGSHFRAKRGLDSKRLELSNQLVSLIESNCDITEETKALELGTGWMHWFSIYTKLQLDVPITMYDVVDNRQLTPLKKQARELHTKYLENGSKITEYMTKIFNNIEQAKSLDEIYDKMDMDYVLDPSGSLDVFESETYDFIFSVNVMEHINNSGLTQYVKDIHKALKPGGHSIHIIDIGDHYHYLLNGRFSNIKEYLSYPMDRWKSKYENELQYINRVQSSQWKAILKNAGFKENSFTEYFSKEFIPVHSDYNTLNSNDVQCYRLVIVSEK